MSTRIEIGDSSRAVELGMGERLYGWVFRREGDTWIPERFASPWETYEASLQRAIKAWKPCKLRVSSDELERLRKHFASLIPRRRSRLDAHTIGGVIEALAELEERRGMVDRLKLIDITESSPELSRIALKVAKLLDIPLWMTPPNAFTTYDRIADKKRRVVHRRGDGDTTDDSIITPHLLTVECSPGGTMSVCIEDRGAIFFNTYASTDSPHVYRALQVLAEAIRRDNEEHPQQ